MNHAEGYAPWCFHLIRNQLLSLRRHFQSAKISSTSLCSVCIIIDRRKSHHRNPKHSPLDNHLLSIGRVSDDSILLSDLDMSASPSVGAYSLDKSILERFASELNLQSLKCLLPVMKAHSLSKFLVTPVLQCRAGPKPVGRVLTNRENMMIMEENERVKAGKAAQKRLG